MATSFSGGGSQREPPTMGGQATGKLYHLRLRVECTLFCNLQRGQSRKDNPDTLPTLDTQDIGRRQTENKNTTQHKKFKRRVTRSPSKAGGWTQMPSNEEQFLRLIRYPTC
jgi:hypothetical protein